MTQFLTAIHVIAGYDNLELSIANVIRHSIKEKHVEEIFHETVKKQNEQMLIVA